MNSWMKMIKAIIWKETIENIRESYLLIPFNILLIIFIQYIVSSHILNSSTIDLGTKKLLINNLIIYSQLMSIPLFGNNLLFRSIFEERRSYSMHILFALGVPPIALWSGKIMSASIIAYISSVLSVLCYIGVLYFYNRFALSVTLYIFFLSFLAIPIISISMLCLMSIIYWSLPKANIFGFIYPLLSFCCIWAVSFNLNIKNPSVLMSMLLILAGVTIIVISLLLVRIIPKERIISV